MSAQCQQRWTRTAAASSPPIVRAAIASGTAHRMPPSTRARDLGRAIAAGEPFVDNFDRCEEKWARLMAGERFADVAAPRF